MAALLDKGVATMDGTVVGTVDGTAVDRLGKNRDQKTVNGKLTCPFFRFFFNLPSVGTSTNCRTIF
jgi:hypothetical protein